jgi:Ca2+/Na+ antiporter
MPVINILTFFASFILIVLVALYIFLIFYNKRTRVTTDKFIKQASDLSPTVLKDIKLHYWISSGQRMQISPNNHCDLYLFNDCLAIIRRQDFIFKVLFAPVLFTSDLLSTKSNFNYLDCYKPDRINFNQFIKGQVDIKVQDPIYRHWKIDITFRELTSEQTKDLEKIKNWC